jgi:hypothetical protein
MYNNSLQVDKSLYLDMLSHVEQQSAGIDKSLYLDMISHV